MTQHCSPPTPVCSYASALAVVALLPASSTLISNGFSVMTWKEQREGGLVAADGAHCVCDYRPFLI